MKALTNDQKIKLLYVAADVGTESTYLKHYHKMVKLILESGDNVLYREAEVINDYLKPVKAWINALR